MNLMTILWRSIRWRLYNPVTILVTIVQPLIWLLLYSTAAGHTMGAAGIGSYPSFILPGLIVLVCFGVCSSTGIMNYLTRRDGSFYRILISPVSRISMIAGQLLEAVLCSFLEAGILCALSLFLSARLSCGPKELALAVLLLSMASFFMAGLAYLLSLCLPNEVVYETVMNAVVLPVFFPQHRLVSRGSAEWEDRCFGKFKSVYPCDKRAARSDYIWDGESSLSVICYFAAFGPGFPHYVLRSLETGKGG